VQQIGLQLPLESIMQGHLVSVEQQEDYSTMMVTAVALVSCHCNFRSVGNRTGMLW